MSVIVESPYIAALKKEYLLKYCSSCFHSASSPCPSCQSVFYCNDECREKDRSVHQLECQMFQRRSEESGEDVLCRMLVRVIRRLELDGGELSVDPCENVSSSVRRRRWSDLLSHRDQLIHSERHRNLWVELNNQLHSSFGDEFDRFDLLEIFGQLLINRFRVGIHVDLREGRVAIGWAIYLTTSVFNHSCDPDLYQCSFDLQMRLKLNPRRLTSIPTENSSFQQLTISYRHQNDFRLNAERSVFLNQIKEKLFFHYQRQEKKKRRATELGEDLIEFYDQYFQHSSIYPKIVLSDLIDLHRSLGEDQRAKELILKLQRLWNEDYPQ